MTAFSIMCSMMRHCAEAWCTVLFALVESVYLHLLYADTLKSGAQHLSSFQSQIPNAQVQLGYCMYFFRFSLSLASYIQLQNCPEKPLNLDPNTSTMRGNSYKVLKRDLRFQYCVSAALI